MIYDIRRRLRTIGVVVNQIEAILVVDCSQVGLSDTETNCIGESLSERTSRDLDTISVSSFGVAWGKRIELTELLQVVQGKLEAEKMKQNILQSTSRRSFRS